MKCPEYILDRLEPDIIARCSRAFVLNCLVGGQNLFDEIGFPIGSIMTVHDDGYKESEYYISDSDFDKYSQILSECNV